MTFLPLASGVRLLVGKIIQKHTVFYQQVTDVTIMMSSSTKFPHMFKKKFPTKSIFGIFPVLRINGVAPFCKLLYRMTLVLIKSSTNYSYYGLFVPLLDYLYHLFLSGIQQ